MSSNHNSGGKRPLVVRVLCLVLAGLMILGTAIALVEAILQTYAAEPDELAGYAFHSEFRKNRYYVAVALRWQGNASVSYPLLAPLGVAFGEVDVQKDSREFIPLFLSDETDIVVTCDANLRVWNGECNFAASEAETNLGGYNVELRLGQEVGSDACIWDALPDLTDLLLASYGHVFRAYVNGEKTVRVGAYANITDATTAAGAISASLEGFQVSVVAPDPNGVTVLNEDCDRILFEYLGDSTCHCAFVPRQSEGITRCYTAFGNKTYDGAIYFCRDNNYNVLTIDNLVRLPEYLEGVVTGEIYTSWTVETIKAFAITANNVIVTSRGKRLQSVGSDVVAGSLDQCYNGTTTAQNVIEACEAVSDYILTYTDEDGNSSLVGTSYSSSQGGYAIDSKCAWYSSVGPYSVSQPTMWEDYTAGFGGGFWKYEVSPTDLCTQVKKTLTGLRGTYITDVSYKTTGEVFTDTADTPYIYSITFTDNLGNTATATRTSVVSSLMGNYAYSANFVIGKNSVDYYYDVVSSNHIIDLSTSFAGSLYVQTDSGKSKVSTSLFRFLSMLGIGEEDKSNALYVRSATGTAILVSDLQMPSTTLPDENGDYTYVSDYNDFLIVSSLRRFEQTKVAATPGNYVIVGKGYGHGVGMSQWGAQHLGLAGATAEQILKAYFPGSDISNFTMWSLTH